MHPTWLSLPKTRPVATSRLLLESDRPVADLAQECGFYDHSAFSRAFRVAMGVTPSEFRSFQGLANYLAANSDACKKTP